MNLAVIPARGGSKRIKGKNIREFHGKPIISYPIEAALDSGLFDKIVVTTDSSEIARVADDCGAETPFMRPADLSDDVTGTDDVVRHAIEWLRDRDEKYEYVCCIYPATPFLEPAHITKAFDMLVKRKHDYVFPVTTFPFPLQRAITITENGGLRPLFPEYLHARSQDLPECYHDAGMFYWGRSEAYCNGVNAYDGNSGVIILPRYEVVDIDDEEDWVAAELHFLSLNQYRHKVSTGDADGD